jgi:hypothetical protein
MREANILSNNWTIYLRTSITWDMIEGKVPIPFQPLAVIEAEPNVYDHIQVGKQRYTVGIVSHKEWRAYVSPITLGGEHDTENTGNAICPHCGHEHADCFEWGADEDEQNCNRCSLPFTYYREVVVEYTTVKKGPSRKKLLVQV